MSVVTAAPPRAAAISRPTAAAGLFRSDIEGLRAVAVLGVIAFHFGMTQLPGGFVGVDIFFVISGYLITQHLVQELDKRGTVDLWAFYARRARRLLPASIFVILVTLAAGYFIMAPSEQQLYSKGALFASTYIINLWLIRWSLDYFAPDASNNPFIHFWSLSVEEQFYLVWPALLLLVAWLRPGKRGIVLAMAAVAVVSLGFCVWLTGVSQPWAFYLSPFRAWEFAFGGLASMSLSQGWAKRFRFSPLLGWTGLALIGTAYLALTEETPFPGFAAVIPAAGTVLVLLAGAHEGGRGAKALLGLAPFQWAGKLSYSLYLWHWPVIVYAGMLSYELTRADRWLLLALTFLLALFTYVFIENPIRRDGWLLAGRSRSLGLAALLTATGAAVAFLNATVAARNFTPELKSIADDAGLVSAARQVSTDCVSGPETAEPDPCDLGAPGAARTMVLFGDSHADHWSTPLADIARKRGMRLVTFLKSSCPVARIKTWNDRLMRNYGECDVWRERAMEEIRSLKPAMVIVSEFSTFYVENSINGLSDHLVDRKSWEGAIRSSLQTLSRTGAEVVLLRDVPLHKRYLDKCVARALWQGRSVSFCDTPRKDAVDGAVAETERRVVSQVANGRYVDLTDRFCNAAVCPAIIGGRLTYHDRHHIATPFAASLAAPLEKAIFGSRMEEAKGAVPAQSDAL